jgi:hypothetical protein
MEVIPHAQEGSNQKCKCKLDQKTNRGWEEEKREKIVTTPHFELASEPQLPNT